MRLALLFRIAFFGVVGLLFGGSLLGILFTVPVFVRQPRMNVELDPSPDRLRADVEKLCTDLSPRSAEHEQNLDRTAEWIAEQFRASGLDVGFQEYDAAGKRFRNVVARRPGSDPSIGAIVIGAHYDAYSGFPGANDNASGVAVLLELVRTLPDDPHRRSHVFVAFSTEEPPFFGSEQMGSYVFAEELKQKGTPILGMISLDMVGYFSDEPRSQRFPFRGLGLLFPDRGDFIAVVGDLKSGPWIRGVKRGMLTADALPVESFRASPRWAPVDLSDHWSFRKLGLPAVQVTDTAFLRFPHYHAPEDTPEKLDYERMAQLVRALHGVLWEGNPP